MMKKLRRIVLKPFQTKKRATKQVLPKALREQVWLKKAFSNKYLITWCSNEITPFDFHIGHHIPKSKGGSKSITILFPFRSRFNLSMRNRYTMGEWECVWVCVRWLVVVATQASKGMRPLLYPGSSVVRRVAACRALACASAKQTSKPASKQASKQHNERR